MPDVSKMTLKAQALIQLHGEVTQAIESVTKDT